MDWHEQYRAGLARLHAAGRIDDHQHQQQLVIVDFAERHNLALTAPDAEIDLWGYGTVRPAFAELDGPGWWVWLHDLVQPAGLDHQQLVEAYVEEVAMGYEDADALEFTDKNGARSTLEAVSHSATMRIFLGRSPWAREFGEALFGAFRRAVVRSGLADKVGPVQLVDEHGNVTEPTKTLAQFLAAGEPLPSREEARARAFAGPSGALPKDGDQP